MAPRVSIVVPAWVAAERLAGCLAAVARCEGRDDAEVLVVLNGATAQVRAVAAAAAAEQPLTLLDSPVNLGFGGGCTFGARRAAAPLSIFLNDDAEPEPGWLLRLLATADERPDAGAIGSVLLGADGLVEECGGEVTATGWSRQLHAGEPRGAIDATGPSPVTYCSAAALLVRTCLVADSPGFDPRFHPAYYEDLDLCVSLAQAGWAVLVEPRAVVHHHRSASTQLRFRDFLSRRNHDRFVAKWDWAGGVTAPRGGHPWHEPAEPAVPADPVDPVLLRRELAVAHEFTADLIATADRLDTELVAARERIHHDHGELVALSERIHQLQRHIDSLPPAGPAGPAPADPAPADPVPEAPERRSPLRRLAARAAGERCRPGRR